jgi:hypothetical protein
MSLTPEVRIDWTATLIKHRLPDYPEYCVPEVECSDLISCGCRNCDGEAFFGQVRAYAEQSPDHHQLLVDAFTALDHTDGLRAIPKV